MTQKIAAAASRVHQLRTGHAPGSVTAVHGDNTLVITLRGALSPSEQVMPHSADGAARVQQFQLATKVPREIPGDLGPICPVNHDAGKTAGSTPLLERNPMNKPLTSSHTQTAIATAPGHTVAHACSCVNGPTHEDIANRAYDIYLKNGRKQGQCKQNWQQAEQSLRDQNQASHRAQEHSSGAVAAHASGAK